MKTLFQFNKTTWWFMDESGSSCDDKTIRLQETKYFVYNDGIKKHLTGPFPTLEAAALALRVIES